MTSRRGVLSDADVEAMRQRNRERAQRAVQQMGSRYVCHPSNLVGRNPMRNDARGTEQRGVK